MVRICCCFHNQPCRTNWLFKLPTLLWWKVKPFLKINTGMNKCPNLHTSWYLRVFAHCFPLPVMSNFLNFFSGLFLLVNLSKLTFWSRKSLLNYPCRFDSSFICFLTTLWAFLPGALHWNINYVLASISRLDAHVKDCILIVFVV